MGEEGKMKALDVLRDVLIKKEMEAEDELKRRVHALASWAPTDLVPLDTETMLRDGSLDGSFTYTFKAKLTPGGDYQRVINRKGCTHHATSLRQDEEGTFTCWTCAIDGIVLSPEELGQIAATKAIAQERERLATLSLEDMKSDEEVLRTRIAEKLRAKGMYTPTPTPEPDWEAIRQAENQKAAAEAEAKRVEEMRRAYDEVMNSVRREPDQILVSPKVYKRYQEVMGLTTAPEPKPLDIPIIIINPDIPRDTLYGLHPMAKEIIFQKNRVGKSIPFQVVYDDPFASPRSTAKRYASGGNSKQRRKRSRLLARVNQLGR